MKVIPGRATGAKAVQRAENFTGQVWGDPVLPMQDGVGINHVFFSPGSRTHWHAHGTGQVLHITGGAGWVCKQGEQRQAIRAGDIVWIGAGEIHWHGAAQDTFMSHLAISMGGAQWHGEAAGE
jgi:quercetin dioxygenase-like cupin family protein